MNKNIKFSSVAVIVVVLLLVILVTGCMSNAGTNPSTVAPSATNATKQYTTLRYTGTIGSVGLLEIADAKGFFDVQGIKIDYVGNVNGGTQSVQALAGGQADIGGSAWAPWINSIAGGSKLKVVVAGSGQNEKEPGILWIVHNNSSIYSARDLIGKKIAVNVLGAEADYVTREYLAKNNISADQVQLVAVPWPQQPQVFASSQADVVAVSKPFSNIILEKDDARILFSDEGERGTTALFVYGIREDLIQQNPQTVKGFVTAITKAADWATANPDDAKKLVADIYNKTGANPDLAKYWTPSQAWPHALIKDSDVQWWIDTMAKNGKLKGQIKPSDIYTNEYNPYST